MNPRNNRLNTLCQLLGSWATAIPKILYNSTFALVIDPKGAQKFVYQVLNAQDLESDDVVLGSVSITDLFGNTGEDVEINGDYYTKQGSETSLLTELASLAYIVKKLKPKLIFEFGTYSGKTTKILAINAPTSKILTIDLYPNQVKHKIGEAFHNIRENKRVTQLYGDTKTFDFSQWYNQCDFVWIDAAHDYKSVLSDSKKALKLCKPGGWIAWHDYRHTAWWSGVTKCVRLLHKSYPKIVHLHGTTIAVLPGKNLK